MRITLKSVRQVQQVLPASPGTEPAGGTRSVARLYGSGSIVEHDDWRATVRLNGTGYQQALDSLMKGVPHQIELEEENVVAFSIETDDDAGADFDIAR